MMDEREDRFDELLRGAAQDYNAPPPTPTAEIWQRIEAARRRPSVTPIRPRAIWRIPIAVAAILTVGVAIGRLTSPDDGPPGRSGVPGAAHGMRAAVTRTGPGTVATRLATANHLSEAETFLTEFNTQAPAEEFTTKAADLLATTRLLLDSKRLKDTGTRQLLEDLELVLVQIATLDPTDRPEELGFIADALAQNHLRTRLRNANPAGPAIRL